jgi:hypothetical protein
MVSIENLSAKYLLTIVLCFYDSLISVLIFHENIPFEIFLVFASAISYGAGTKVAMVKSSRLVSKGVDVTSDTAFSSDIADVSMELSKHDIRECQLFS